MVNLIVRTSHAPISDKLVNAAYCLVVFPDSTLRKTVDILTFYLRP